MRTETSIERRNGFLEGVGGMLRSRLGNILLGINLVCISWWVVVEWMLRPEIDGYAYHYRRPVVIGLAVVVYALLATPTWLAMWLLGAVFYPLFLMAPYPHDDAIARAAFVLLSSAQWLLVGHYLERRRAKLPPPRLSVVPASPPRRPLPRDTRPLGIF